MSVKVTERKDGTRTPRLQVVIWAMAPGKLKPERFRYTAPRNITSKSGAQRWGEQVRREIEAGKPPPQSREGKAKAVEDDARVEQVAAAAEKEAMTVAQWVDEYLADCRARRVRETTVRMRARELRHLLVVAGDRRVADFSELDWQRLRRQLADLMASTANMIVQLVASVLRAAHRAGLRGPVQTPAKIRPEAKVDTEEECEAYTVDEYERMVAAARTMTDDHLAVVLLGGDAGLRCGEIAGLKVSDVVDGVLTVRRTVVEIDGERVVHIPKGGKTRQVPASDRLLDVLRRLADESRDGWLVHAEESGDPARTYNVVAFNYTVQRKARLPQKGPHKLRHTFATHALESGATPKELQELLGHSTLAQVERYTHRTRPKSTAIERMAQYRADAGDTTVPQPALVVVR